MLKGALRCVPRASPSTRGRRGRVNGGEYRCVCVCPQCLPARSICWALRVLNPLNPHPPPLPLGLVFVWFVFLFPFVLLVGMAPLSLLR